jgi:hypothetical protein
MKGTDTNAPPAPTSDDSRPMPLPTPKVASGPGSVRPGLGLRSRKICVAENATKIANRMPSSLPGRATAICAPITEPTRMPGASTLTTGHSTAPRLWCARTDMSEVKQMVASDVATAIFSVRSGG